MNRKEFLKNFACAFCSCGAVGLAAPASAPGAEAKDPEDWRLPFVKQRYARLLEILSSRMDEKTLNDTLFDLGAYCSGLGDDWRKKFRGDLEGFRQAVKRSKSADNITYDWDKGLITMASDDRTDCFCPLISLFSHTPKVACNCSLGWQQHTWETLLQKKVKVELKESVLRGGKRCVFEIRLDEKSAVSPVEEKSAH
ncbi:MAG: hypothetical protein ABSH38_02495 [Verrucomicrobiota bacterium]|jgi:hypothetical protein